jgi:hypothetical protein
MEGYTSKYFIKVSGADEREVDEEEWMRYEARLGYHSKKQVGELLN